MMNAKSQLVTFVQRTPLPPASVGDGLKDERNPDAVTYITHRYVAAMEKIVLGHLVQYLWAHRR